MIKHALLPLHALRTVDAGLGSLTTRPLLPNQEADPGVEVAQAGNLALAVGLSYGPRAPPLHAQQEHGINKLSLHWFNSIELLSS